MKRVLIGAVSALFVLGMAAESSAATYKAVYTGYVIKGFDNLGIFGDAARFDGARYSATYIFDSDLGEVEQLTSTQEYRRGGSSEGAATPILDAFVEINGVTVHFNGDWLGVLDYRQAYHVLHGVNSGADGQSGMTNLIRYTPFTRVTDTGSFGGTADSGGGVAIYNDDRSDATTASWVSERVTLTAVPEPASWALMILGSGLVGGVLRRRRGAAAEAA